MSPWRLRPCERMHLRTSFCITTTCQKSKRSDQEGSARFRVYIQNASVPPVLSADQASSQRQQRTVDGKLSGHELERRYSRKRWAPYHGERETAKGVGDRQRGRKIQSKTRTQYKQSPAHQAIRQGRMQTSSEGGGSRQQETK